MSITRPKTSSISAWDVIVKSSSPPMPLDQECSRTTSATASVMPSHADRDDVDLLELLEVEQIRIAVATGM